MTTEFDDDNNDEAADNDGDNDEATISTRLQAAEDQIRELNTKASVASDAIKHITWLIVVTVFVGLTVTVIASFTSPKPHASTNDATLDALMTPNVHCYDSKAERDAARQRALAEIDRQHWQLTHQPQDSRDTYSEWGVSASSTKLPEVLDKPGPNATWDAATCFQVK